MPWREAAEGGVGPGEIVDVCPGMDGRSAFRGGAIGPGVGPFA